MTDASARPRRPRPVGTSSGTPTPQWRSCTPRTTGGWCGSRCCWCVTWRPPRRSCRTRSSRCTAAGTGCASRTTRWRTCGRPWSTGPGRCCAARVVAARHVPRGARRTPPGPTTTAVSRRAAYAGARRAARPCPGRQREVLALRYYLDLSESRDRRDAGDQPRRGEEPRLARRRRPAHLARPAPAGGQVMSNPYEPHGLDSGQEQRLRDLLDDATSDVEPGDGLDAIQARTKVRTMSATPLAGRRGRGGRDHRRHRGGGRRARRQRRPGRRRGPRPGHQHDVRGRADGHRRQLGLARPRAVLARGRAAAGRGRGPGLLRRRHRPGPAAVPRVPPRHRR